MPSSTVRKEHLVGPRRRSSNRAVAAGGQDRRRKGGMLLGTGSRATTSRRRLKRCARATGAGLVSEGRRRRNWRRLRRPTKPRRRSRAAP